MPAPRELSQQIPAPQGGGKFLVQIPGVGGGMVMDEIDTCISQFLGGGFLLYRSCLASSTKTISLTSLSLASIILIVCVF